MTYSLIVEPAAEQDLHQAYRWYQKQRKGLGDEFLLEFDSSLSKICENPFANLIIYKNVHRFLIRRFPYGIFYIVEGESIFIIAIQHKRRDPNSWKRRVPS